MTEPIKCDNCKQVDLDGVEIMHLPGCPLKRVTK